MIKKSKYWLFLLMLTAVSNQLLIYLINHQYIPVFWGWQGIVFAFFISSLIGKIIIDLANKSDDPKERVFITSIYLGVKTLTHLAIILIYFKATRSFTVPFVLTFFVLFLIFTGLDLYFSLSKKNQ